mmetsp:Transcript_11792/g.1761  ORF Transcript_11792/g.1761 Transcript_11792/m.1761 type:complete len:87 (+) Transcript_11792:67-327(+)
MNFLCLSATLTYEIKHSPPHPQECSLYHVNKSTLLSYKNASELFLYRIQSLFVASHYKNSPDDLLLLSDAPGHEIFVLLGPLGNLN